MKQSLKLVNFVHVITHAPLPMTLRFFKKNLYMPKIPNIYNLFYKL